MCFFFLDIKQSAYIFQQQIAIYIITFVICIILVGVCIYKMLRAKGSTLEVRQIISRNIFFAIAVLIVYFLILFPLWKDTLVLRSRGIEASGKTTAWINHGDGQFMVSYEFEVNGEHFSGESEIVYGGKQIKGILCPGGHYIVIYDPKNPFNCVMDFKRPITNEPGLSQLVNSYQK